MNFLKRIFKGRRSTGTPDDASRLARELESLIAEAERLVAAGRHEEALQVAESGLRRFPGTPRLRSVVQYVRRTGAQKRLQELKTTLDERKDERAYRELIALHLDLGNKDQALEVARGFSEEFPDSPEAHVQLGEVYLARYFNELFARDAWTASECFERALELDPDTIRAHARLALLHYGIGAYQTQMVSVAGDEMEEDIEYLLDYAEDRQEIPNDPAVFPGGKRFSLENQGGALSPKLFASAAAGIGRRLRIEQLAAIGSGGRPLAVAGENKENFVRLACRLDAAARRAGRHMNFGTMRRFMVEGKFGRVVLVPAGNCAVAARAPRSVGTDRIAQGLEMVVSASRAEEGEEDA